jgi:type I restriction enzyme S subunit
MLLYQEEIVKFLDEIYGTYKIEDTIKYLGDANLFNLLINKRYDEFKSIIWYQEQVPRLMAQLEQVPRYKNDYIRGLFNTLKGETVDFYKLYNFTQTGTTIDKSKRKNGTIPYYGTGGITGYTSTELFDGGYLLFSHDGSSGNVQLIDGKFWCNHHIRIFKFKENINIKYIYMFFKNFDFNKYIKKHSIPSLGFEVLKTIKIKLPSLEDQEKIIKQIEDLEKDGSQFTQMNNILKKQIETITETIKNLCNIYDTNEIVQVTENIETENTVEQTDEPKEDLIDDVKEQEPSSLCDDLSLRIPEKKVVKKVIVKKNTKVKKIIDDESIDDLADEPVIEPVKKLLKKKSTNA